MIRQQGRIVEPGEPAPDPHVHRAQMRARAHLCQILIGQPVCEERKPLAQFSAQLSRKRRARQRVFCPDDPEREVAVAVAGERPVLLPATDVVVWRAQLRERRICAADRILLVACDEVTGLQLHFLRMCVDALLQPCDQLWRCLRARERFR